MRVLGRRGHDPQSPGGPQPPTRQFEVDHDRVHDCIAEVLGLVWVYLNVPGRVLDVCLAHGTGSARCWLSEARQLREQLLSLIHI